MRVLFFFPPYFGNAFECGFGDVVISVFYISGVIFKKDYTAPKTHVFQHDK